MRGDPSPEIISAEHTSTTSDGTAGAMRGEDEERGGCLRWRPPREGPRGGADDVPKMSNKQSGFKQTEVAFRRRLKENLNFTH